MPEYRVLAHRRVLKFLKQLEDENLKNRLKETILSLEDYPIILKKVDAEKLENLEGGYRIRLGEYRIIFVVDRKRQSLSHILAKENQYTRRK